MSSFLVINFCTYCSNVDIREVQQQWADCIQSLSNAWGLVASETLVVNIVTYQYSSLDLLRTEEMRMDGVLDRSLEENDQDRTQAVLATLLGFCEARDWKLQLRFLWE